MHSRHIARPPAASVRIALLSALFLALLCALAPLSAGAAVNFYPAQRGNWSAPVVPRYHTVGSTFFDTVDFEPLYGDSDCVYMYTAVGNNGADDSVNPVSLGYYRDGVFVLQSTPLFNTVPAGLSVAFVDCIGAIPAGLHTVASVIDISNETAESSETDNTYGMQIAMIPRAIAPGQLVVRPQPPSPTGGATQMTGTRYPNQDGVRLPAISASLGTWSAVALHYSSTGDYDLNLYEPSTRSDNGFRTPLVSSNTRVTRATEAVFVNHAITGARAKDVGIVYVSGGNTALLEHRTNTGGATTLVLNSTVSRTFANDQMVMVEEFLHTPTAGMPFLRVSLQGPTVLPFHLMWAYGDSVASRSSLAAQTVTTDFLSGFVTVDIPVPTTGPAKVLGLFIVRDAFNAGTAPFNFSLSLESKPNLANVPRPGWLAPIGVGNTSPSLTAEPATLNAGATAAVLGWANDGTRDASAFDYRVYVDGAQVAAKTVLSLAQGAVSLIGPSLGSVTGGRHTVSDAVDVTGALAEFNENDNRYGKQWVWTPPAITGLVTMPAPPDPQGGWSDMPASATKRDNLAAQRVTYSLLAATRFGATLMTPGLGTDNSMAWYVPGGPTDGLQSLVQACSLPGDRTEALMVRGLAVTYDAGVRRESGSASYTMQRVLSTALGTLPLTSGTLTINAGSIGALYALTLPTIAGPGGDLQILLENLSGNADLAMALIPATGGPTFDVGSLSASFKADAAGAGAGEELAAGQFAWDGSQVGLLVYKVSASEVSKTASFRLTTSGGAVAGVGDALPHALAFAASGENPVRGTAQLRLDLPSESDAAVTLYDVSGREVRVLSSGVRAAGVHRLSWDLRDAAGATVGNGIYFAACRVGTWQRVVRVMVVR